ncbi:hypothetical protein ACFYUJ_38785 [Streptomyces sp. NPDC004520]|uniref:hypothetical protein n=1 Tax=Streptomyces sp. NPDC004520 TaxID=3364702 RepID=UPI0036C575FD
MTIHYLSPSASAEPGEPEPVSLGLFGCVHRDPLGSAAEAEEREPWPGEEEALAQAAATGRRAANWIRSLPLPAGAWICGPLADAVDEAMSTLDPGDCDDVDRYGQGGVSESARERLAGLIYHAADMAPLTGQQRVALFAVVHAVQGIPKALTNDPGTVIERDLPVLCAIIDSAIGTDGAAITPPRRPTTGLRTGGPCAES